MISGEPRLAVRAEGLSDIDLWDRGRVMQRRTTEGAVIHTVKRAVSSAVQVVGVMDHCFGAIAEIAVGRFHFS
ncbi:hypothetical protein MAGR_70110 [Mycolicibacterium agri]|uniref:Uncharacterized protein n=1 Tax=Mycolicibacterium agri TaxID=36811 RepID=A0A7I9WDQ9_MYCAG|nr:hypothetical protein MAGR_70110 [Mycolicibacterium agri]